MAVVLGLPIGTPYARVKSAATGIMPTKLAPSIKPRSPHAVHLRLSNAALCVSEIYLAARHVRAFSAFSKDHHQKSNAPVPCLSSFCPPHSIDLQTYLGTRAKHMTVSLSLSLSLCFTHLSVQQHGSPISAQGNMSAASFGIVQREPAQRYVCFLLLLEYLGDHIHAAVKGI